MSKCLMLEINVILSQGSDGVRVHTPVFWSLSEGGVLIHERQLTFIIDQLCENFQNCSLWAAPKNHTLLQQQKPGMKTTPIISLNK